MKNTKIPFTYIIILLLTGLITQSAVAQKEGQYFLLTEWSLQFPEDGEHEDIYHLLGEWHEMIVLKNPKMISEKTVVQHSENTTWSWVVITEYASRDDIDWAAATEEKLIAEGWPEQEKRTIFFQAFDKYSISRSDGIIVDIPLLEQSYLPYD